jgi:hypothetical protein
VLGIVEGLPVDSDGNFGKSHDSAVMGPAMGVVERWVMLMIVCGSGMVY